MGCSTELMSQSRALRYHHVEVLLASPAQPTHLLFSPLAFPTTLGLLLSPVSRRWVACRRMEEPGLGELRVPSFDLASVSLKAPYVCCGFWLVP